MEFSRTTFNLQAISRARNLGDTPDSILGETSHFVITMEGYLAYSHITSFLQGPDRSNEK
jgi:hypothetical protein